MTRRRSLLVLSLATLALITLMPPDAAPARSPAAKATFTDAEIADGFFKVAFGAEYRLAGPSDRIRKFTTPVRVAIDGDKSPRRRATLQNVVATIGARIAHLDIAIAARGEAANVTVTLVRDRDMRRTIAQRLGKEHARAIRRRLDPQCLSGFRRNEQFAIERAEVILAVDTDDFTFRDCAYEEMLQALGPINDTDTVPWTMFNDAVRTGAFGVYDQLLLNILYDPRIRPGMSAAEVKALLPQVLPEVRAFVGTNNKPRR
ncbi:MAG: hypothetical protein DCC74_03665 [Proteobacteria bacterium]|nr:MAG: hypothetical protein DCC74_03665 [Pseudomonadota bacterium]